MSDKFGVHPTQLNSPAAGAFAVVPNDGQDLSLYTRALNVATSGVVRVDMINGDTVDLFIAAGCAFPVRVRRVHATGTTATGLVGLV